MMETCVNCCQILEPSQNDAEGNNESDLNPQEISKSLSEIYKLNYLSAFFDPPSSSLSFSCSTSDTNPVTTATIKNELQNEDDIICHIIQQEIQQEQEPTASTVYNINGKLCDNCLDIYKSLYKFYDSFNQLRSLESSLAVEIKKLDDCIEAHKFIRKIQEEKTFTDQYSQCSASPPGPWVVLKRLESDELAQAVISNSNSKSTRVKRGRRKIKPTAKFIKSDDEDIENEPKIKISKVKTKLEQEDYFDNDNSLLPRPVEPEEEEEEEGEEREQEDGHDMDMDDINFYPNKTEEKKETKKKTKKTRKQKTSTKKIVKKKKKTTITTTKVKNSDYDDIDDEYYDLEDQEDEEEEGGEGNNSSGGGRKRRRLDIEGQKQRRDERKKVDYEYQKRKTLVPNPCWHCNLDFPTQQECYDHTMSEHYKEGDYMCDHCSKIMSSKMSFTLHQKIQCDSLKPGEILPGWTCMKCEEKGKHRSFPLKKAYTEHLRTVHTHGESLSCTIDGCTYTTHNPLCLKQHIRFQHSAEPEPMEERTCDVCQKIFKNKYLRNCHYKSMHTPEGMERYRQYQNTQAERRKEKNKDKPSLLEETFCAECMVEFFTYNCLMSHRKTMHATNNNFAFVCDQCGKSFARKARLQYHKNHVHTDVRAHCCDQCGKSFKSYNGLQDHIKHTHDEQGRLEYNAKMRLKNQRRKIRNQALQESISKGIPQFTGAQFTGENSNNSNPPVINMTVQSTSDGNIEVVTIPNQNTVTVIPISTTATSPLPTSNTTFTNAANSMGFTFAFDLNTFRLQ